MIEKQTRHVTRLVDDLLDVSRLELGKVDLRMQRVNLNDTLTAAADACVPLTSARRHAVSVRPWKQPLVVRADPVRLEQVIGNLIVNAAKFTPEGGTIGVEAFPDGEHGVVVVTDNGVGIKPEMLESIFDLFMQDAVSPARTEGGLGIGLTLVRRLVELHGGSVRAVSAGLGSGSRFEVRLPLDPRRSERDSGRPAADLVSPPRRVLIVEDGDDTRDSLGMLISNWSHEVSYAASGPEGVERALEGRPDVALVDIALPGFDGYEVARRIRHEDSSWARHVRLIALTGYGQSADRAKAIDAGFDVHVLKPVDPAELRALLTAAAPAA
jgi:CheY-like chemotaxis protein